MKRVKNQQEALATYKRFGPNNCAVNDIVCVHDLKNKSWTLKGKILQEHMNEDGQSRSYSIELDNIGGHIWWYSKFVRLVGSA